MLKLNDEKILMDYFPDGTLHLKQPIPTLPITITWYYECNEEMVSLYFLVHHLKAHGVEQIELFMPYIPNARQDRIKHEEDVFSLKYFAKWLNDLGFTKVKVLDAHSDVALGLIDRVEACPVKPYIEKALKLSGLQEEKDIIFYPDQGSQKRYADLVPFPHAFGLKKRNWETGEILGLEVIGDIPKEPFNVLIIDDISSYGGTFFFAAQKLKTLGAQNIDLYVTHCEPNILKGKFLNEPGVRQVYTTNSLFQLEHPKITVLPL